MGIVLLYKIVWKLYILLRNNFLLKELNLLQRYSSSSGSAPWVLITGATDGIGWGFAQHFAKRGFNIVLIGRSKEKTDGRAQELKTQSPKVSVRTVLRDFTNCGSVDFFKGIVDELKGLDIGLLVNNVGIAEGALIGFEDEKVFNTVLVNCMPQAMMLQTWLKVLEGRKGCRSAVIDVSSLSSVKESGAFPIYSASKVFNKYLTLGTDYTQQFKNVDFLCLTPGWVMTNLISGKLPENPLAATVDECVGGALKCLGQTNQCYGAVRSMIHGMIIETLNFMLPTRYVMMCLFLFNKILFKFSAKPAQKKDQ